MPRLTPVVNVSQTVGYKSIASAVAECAMRGEVRRTLTIPMFDDWPYPPNPESLDAHDQVRRLQACNAIRPAVGGNDMRVEAHQADAFGLYYPSENFGDAVAALIAQGRQYQYTVGGILYKHISPEAIRRIVKLMPTAIVDDPTALGTDRSSTYRSDRAKTDGWVPVSYEMMVLYLVGKHKFTKAELELAIAIHANSSSYPGRHTITNLLASGVLAKKNGHIVLGRSAQVNANQWAVLNFQFLRQITNWETSIAGAMSNNKSVQKSIAILDSANECCKNILGHIVSKSRTNIMTAPNTKFLASQFLNCQNFLPEPSVNQFWEMVEPFSKSGIIAEVIARAFIWQSAMKSASAILATGSMARTNLTNEPKLQK